MQILLIDDSDIDNAVNTKLLKLARLSDDVLAFTSPRESLVYLIRHAST